MVNKNDFTVSVLKEIDYLRPHAVKLTNSVFDAKDLLQETVIRAMKFQEKYMSTHNNLRGWLYTIMRNLYYSSLRQKAVLIEIDPESEYMGRDLNAAESRLQTQYFYGEISKLPPILSEPLGYLAEGYSYEEISKKLQLPIGTVKVRICRARKRLSTLGSLRQRRVKHNKDFVADPL